MLPVDIDIGIQTLLATTGYNVYQSDFVPSFDLKNNSTGYMVWSTEQFTPNIDSEGHSEPSSGKGTYNFELDVICFHSNVATRKTISDALLDVLQPVVGTKRTFLTSYAIGSTGVFVCYIRLNYADKIYDLKTGQSNPEVVGSLYNFSCKFTA